jgi:hypothetical protein
MKKRRDITLGEMQDECKRFTDGLCGGKSCAYQDLCNQMKSGCTPHAWDLTATPRFNEHQMAFWRGWYEIGCKSISVGYNGNFIFDMNENGVVVIKNYAAVKLGLNLKVGETLDLAKLLGKENNER